jgi:photosystem I P700 chlorophyll a apoprotein A1
VSAWDHVYLGLFWMYNCISVVIFHFSWKLQTDALAVSSGNGASYLTNGSFALNSTTINGWLRDFLWSESSQVIQSYGSQGGSYGLLFLGAHFVWAFSLMFLLSIRSANRGHSLSPRTSKKKTFPVGRAAGITHYLLGGIVTTWAFFQGRL